MLTAPDAHSEYYAKSTITFARIIYKLPNTLSPQKTPPGNSRWETLSYTVAIYTDGKCIIIINIIIILLIGAFISIFQKSVQSAAWAESLETC